MYQIRIISVLLFAFKLLRVNSQSCNGNNISVYYQEQGPPNGSLYDGMQVKGCISDESFPGKKIVKLWIVNESTPNLQTNFISHMQYLQEIDIDNSNLKTIEPGAFSDLPQLKYIYISDNPIRNISKGVFNVLPSLQSIQIFLNKISFIEEGAFANLPNLEEIILQRNNIGYLKREWFTNTTNIKTFDVFRNSIRKIPFGMFHGWRKLKELYLNSNAISLIEGELFRDNPKLISQVTLSQNRLESINPITFTDSVFISNLRIDANLLNYVPEEVLRTIRVGSVFIYGNPLTCSCLKKIKRIFLERSVIVDNPEDKYVKSCKDGNVGVPICAENLETCVDAVDKDQTRRFLTYLKSIRYDAVRDEAGEQCAMFDYLD